jgi:hypothetical protein
MIHAISPDLFTISGVVRGRDTLSGKGYDFDLNKYRRLSLQHRHLD